MGNLTDLDYSLTKLSNSSDNFLVAVLLCTFNGERFLAEQLESLNAQTYRNWFVIVSDDGSSDKTIDILLHYKSHWPAGKMFIRRGPQKGFCLNFLSLACDTEIKADFFAFCDQDDVWLPEKLTVSINSIRKRQISNIPYLYCARTEYVSKDLKPCGKSPLFVFPRSFRNALVQSIAGGNTMVFNRPAKLLLEKTGPLNVVSHDWWLYQLVTGVEGEVFYDSKITLLYRQHESALVGGNNSLIARFRRVALLFRGRFHDWNTLNIVALKKHSHLLAKSNQEILQMFEALRNASLKDRFRLIGVCGLYRQTKRGTLSLFLAALINKL